MVGVTTIRQGGNTLIRPLPVAHNQLAGGINLGHVHVQRPKPSRHVQGRNEQAVAHGFKFGAQLRQGEGLAGQGAHELPAALPRMFCVPIFCVLDGFRARPRRTYCRGRTEHGLHLRFTQGCTFPARVGMHHGKVEAERAGIHETG